MHPEFEPEQLLGRERRSLEEAMNLREIAELADMETFGDVANVPSAGDVVVQAATVNSGGRHRMGRYAAAVTGVAAVFALLFAAPWARWSAGNGSAGLAVEELVTGAGETNTVLLSDGSVVRMGPESRLRISGNHQDREVILHGRAFFAVASNPDRTFRVVTPGGAVRALGTRFQVDANASDVQVMVLEGRVAVDGVGSQVEVGSGQMVRTQGHVLRPIEPAPTMSELSKGWLGRFLVFKNTPLSRAIEDLESMYGVNVVVTEAIVPEPTLTMWLAEPSLDHALTIICNVIDAECGVEGTTVTIVPRQSPQHAPH